MTGMAADGDDGAADPDGVEDTDPLEPLAELLRDPRTSRTGLSGREGVRWP